eukprot:5592395-Alexandrium_andersonii.AAC.1
MHKRVASSIVWGGGAGPLGPERALRAKCGRASWRASPRLPQAVRNAQRSLPPICGFTPPC